MTRILRNVHENEIEILHILPQLMESLVFYLSCLLVNCAVNNFNVGNELLNLA